MKISFSPQRSDETLVVSKAGDVLTINGEAFDFSIIPDGATIPAQDVASPFVIGVVERVSGDLHIEFKMPIGPIPAPWEAFPEPLINPGNGVILSINAETE